MLKALACGFNHLESALCAFKQFGAFKSSLNQPTLSPPLSLLHGVVPGNYPDKLGEVVWGKLDPSSRVKLLTLVEPGWCKLDPTTLKITL